MKTKRTLRAFTLIELLTVVAIIGILASLLFPVFSRAKDTAYSVTCLSNLRELGHSFQMYEEDNDGLFPMAVDFTDYPLGPSAWAGSGVPHALENVNRLEETTPDPVDGDDNGGRIDHILRPYVKDEHLFRCPGDTGFGGIGYAAYDGPFVLYNLPPYVSLWQQSRYYSAHNKRKKSIWGGTSYLYRTDLCLWMRPASSLRNPSNTNVLMDGAHYWHTTLHRTPILSTGYVNKDLADVNKGRINTLFADTHVKPLTWGENKAVWSTRVTDPTTGHEIEKLWQSDIDITELHREGW